MRLTLSRREFLKLAGTGLAASIAAGAASRVESLLFRSPGGLQESFTVCGGCPAACGLRLVWDGEQLLSFAGNPYHPHNRGRLCGDGKAYLQNALDGLKSPLPFRRVRRGVNALERISWEQAVGILKDALRAYRGDEIAFLIGAFPSSRIDFFTYLAQYLGANPPVVWDSNLSYSGLSTLCDASHLAFGIPIPPLFDIPNADLVLLLGASGEEPWLGAGSRLAAEGFPFWRGEVLQIGARRSANVPAASRWLPLLPGREPFLLAALGLVLERSTRGYSQPPEISHLAAACGWSTQSIQSLAESLLDASAPVIVPGSLALTTQQGSQIARRVLALNCLLDNLGQPGGVHLPVLSTPTGVPPRYPATQSEFQRLITRIQDGKIKALFIYASDPVGEFWSPAEFEKGLENVPLVVSLTPEETATSLLADYIFPDCSPLLMWGYHHVPWSDRPLAGALMPGRVGTDHDYSTVRLFAEALSGSGGNALGFSNDWDFLLQGVGGAAFETSRDWRSGLERGGWWRASSLTMPPVMVAAALDFLEEDGKSISGEILLEDEFYLHPLWMPKTVGQQAGWEESGLSWCEIHPQSAARLRITAWEIVRVVSREHEIRARVRLNANIHPRVLALQLPVGSLAISPPILEERTNQSGDLAWMGDKIHLRKGS